MREPKYLTYARSFNGQSEYKSTNKAPFILRMLTKLKATWLYGQPWCGFFVADCLAEFKWPIPKHWYRARAWLDYGIKIDAPCLGCIVIFNRAGGGHVGFVVGRDYAGQLLVLGGNQANKVSIAPFAEDRILGYRLPTGYWMDRLPLPRISLTADLSYNES